MIVALNRSHKQLQLEIACTSLICNKPVMVYCKLDRIGAVSPLGLPLLECPTSRFKRD